jgi:hypothetical protein
MSQGQESGANGSQESALGPNKAEQCPTADDSATLDAIARICDRYEQTIGRQAHHAVIEIASVIRNGKAHGAAMPKGGAA